jgi:hypothetical protein
VRRFATAGVWAGDAESHAAGQPDMAAAFDAQMRSRPADADADAADAVDSVDSVDSAASIDDTAPTAAERRC